MFEMFDRFMFPSREYNPPAVALFAVDDSGEMHHTLNYLT